MLYKLIEDLLYFDNNERGFRLCIFIIMKEEIFKLAYNEIEYLGYARIYKKLTEGLYLFNIVIKFYKFIRYYPYY